MKVANRRLINGKGMDFIAQHAGDFLGRAGRVGGAPAPAGASGVR